MKRKLTSSAGKKKVKSRSLLQDLAGNVQICAGGVTASLYRHGWWEKVVGCSEGERGGSESEMCKSMPALSHPDTSCVCVCVFFLKSSENPFHVHLFLTQYKNLTSNF